VARPNSLCRKQNCASLRNAPPLRQVKRCCQGQLDSALTRDFASCCGTIVLIASNPGVHMQPLKKVARADRIEGSILLYRSAARSQFNAQKPLSRGEPLWNMVFGVPLFLRTLFRLVFVCLHRHKGPPITPRVTIPSNLLGRRSVFGRETYIICLDCGQKFAYNHKTRRLVDFWGVHDAEALAGVRRRVDEFFSPLRGLAARVGRLNVRNSMSELVKSVHRLGILTKGQVAKSRR
jgi:hypothetical protein